MHQLQLTHIGETAVAAILDKGTPPLPVAFDDLTKSRQSLPVRIGRGTLRIAFDDLTGSRKSPPG
jgi:hypothetical protein